MRITAFIACFTFSMVISAQNFDFGKVSKEELIETHSPIDSAASASYLFKYRKTHFEYRQNEGFVLITEVHERIKLYNQDGFNYGTKTVRLYKDNSDKEQIVGLKGYTYNLVNNKIEESKLDKSAVFKTEASKYLDETSFTMPNLKPGAIIEYKYKINSPFVFNVDEFVFQHDIPIKKLDAEFQAPEYFNFKVNTKGFLSVIPETETKRGRITFNSVNRGVNGPSKYSSDNVEFVKNISKFNLENIPALKEEPFVNNIDNYRSAVKYELSYTQYPQSAPRYYSTTWQDVVKKIYESPSFGDELKKTSYFSSDIDALIGNVSDPMKRAALIYNHVKQRVKWNGYYSYFTRDGVKKAYKDQVGNVAEINLMLTAMLNYAGIKTYPVLVSTRQHGIPLFPTREGYNYVIAYIKHAGNEVLLDATDKYGMPNVLPYRTLNWQGRVVSEHGNSTMIDLYPNNISKNTVSMMIELEESGDIHGSLRTVKTSHSALSYRHSYNEANKDDFLEKLENKYDGMEVSDFEVKNDYDLSKPIMESYSFEKESQADVIGDKMYFSPLFFFSTDENPFKLEKREYPVDFGYPSETSYRANVKIPENYKIESLPESGVFSLPDNLGMFKYNIRGNGNTIQVVISTKMNTPIISPVYYESLKMYFSQLVEKEAEQIVLTKV